MLSIYNTLTKKIAPFKPIKPGTVRIYSCGPTVYDRAHIGNLRYFMFCDIFKRYLQYSGLKVTHALNLTDVDDKTIKKSQTEGKPLGEVTQRYSDLFLQDCETLGWKKPDALPRATEYINEMVEFIQKLLEKGYAYQSEDGSVYYDISKFKNYGKLSHVELSGLESGASGRIKKDEYAKEQMQDFALWKAWDRDDGEVCWETPIGRGRPGWHIECSAMSSKILGIPFDCHLGGVDLIFPHHENEIAQSEAATGKKFANYWIHVEHLIVNGRKMSKSLGNFYTLKDLLDKNYKPKAIRYLLISTHYRQKLNFTFKGLEAAQNALQRIHEFMESLDTIKAEHAVHKTVADALKRVKAGFEKAMDNDLEISEALGVIFEFIRQINKVIKNLGVNDASKIIKQMLEFDSVLGFIKPEAEKLPKEIRALAEKREAARKQKDWRTADILRDELKQLGYEIKDTTEGHVIRKI